MPTEARAVPDFNREVHCLLGLPFDAVDLADAEARIRLAAERGRRCFLSTPNVNFVVNSAKDESFRRSVVASDLSVADGMPLVWLARLLGIPIRSRVAGSDLFEALRGGAAPLTVYFFGGLEGAAEKAARALGARCVGHAFPGHGSVESMSAEALIAHINAARPDLLVVALGAAKGQAWIQHNRHRLDVPVVSHLGAALDFAAGTVKRAPRWMQDTGLEWLWRIKERPSLWRRYAHDAASLLKIIVTRALPYAWYRRRGQPAGIARIETREQAQSCVLRLRGPWGTANLARLRRAFHQAARSGKHVRLDLGEVTHVDTAFVGLAMLLEAHQRAQGRGFRVAAASEPVRRVLGYCCAEYLYVGAAEKGADPFSVAEEDEATEAT